MGHLATGPDAPMKPYNSHVSGCGQTFAREMLIRDAPAFKMIGGTMHMK